MHDEDTPDRGYESAGCKKSGQVYARLKSLIVLQKLPPRTPLEMKQIAEKFGVSITPVREALIALAHEGIIAKGGSRSYVTLPLNVQDVAADYQAAFMVVKFSLERSDHALSLRGLRIRSFANDWRGKPEEFPRSMALAVEDLYERLANATYNPRLVRLMQDFNDRTTFTRQLDFHDPGRARSTVESMLRFVDLLEQGDVEAAVENLDTQLSQKLDMLPTLVREGNQRAIEAVDFLNE